MDFEFIQDQRFKELLQRDFQELTICHDNKSSKAVLILTGSIIEAVLVEFFLQNLPAGKSENDVLRLTLGVLVDMAEKEGLLTSKEKNLASVIQDYRNLIHPGRQIRESEKYDFETATIAISLLRIITDAIRLKQQSTNSLSANEVVERLKNDWSFRSIYNRIIIKLNHAERNKLIDLLLIYEIEDKERWDAFLYEGYSRAYPIHNLEVIKPLVSELKPLLQPEIIMSKLNELSKEIERGEALKAFALFNFFHEDIDKLSPDEQELIAIYFLSTFSSLLEKCNDLVNDKTYSTIGKYLRSENGLSAFNEFSEFCVVHFSKSKLGNYEMDLYEQAFNSLKEENKIKCSEYLYNFLYGGNKKPPKMIEEAFVEDATKRGILHYFM